MKQFVAFLAFITPSALYAEDLMHFAAHVGASYAINTVSYSLVNSIMLSGTGCGGDGAYSTDCVSIRQRSRVKSLVVSAIVTLAVGFTYKYLELKKCENAGGQACWSAIGGNTSMLRNTLGVAASAGTIMVFKF